MQPSNSICDKVDEYIANNKSNVISLAEYRQSTDNTNYNTVKFSHNIGLVSREKSIDSLLRNEGMGVVYKNGQTEGDSDDVKQAQDFKSKYMNFKDSREGQSLINYLGGDFEFDGYAVMDMGDKAMAAVMYDDKGKAILALNKRYANRLNNSKDYLDILSHEHIHGYDVKTKGTSNEESANTKAAEFYRQMAEESDGLERRVYQRVADTAESRHSYNQQYAA